MRMRVSESDEMHIHSVKKCSEELFSCLFEHFMQVNWNFFCPNEWNRFFLC